MSRSNKANLQEKTEQTNIAQSKLIPDKNEIAKALGLKSVSICWLAGDGSDRSYYRIRCAETHSTFVLMRLSKSEIDLLRNDKYEWITVGKILEEHGVCVPKPIKALPEQGSLVIEDYGDDMFESIALKNLEKDELFKIEELYLKAIKIISNFLSIPRRDGLVWTKRSFDKARFIWELNFFLDNYLEPLMEKKLCHEEKKIFDIEINSLGEHLEKLSNYFVHRDYHSRNLMYKDNEIAVIDFQDARLGHPAYDLVSLCFDSYIPLKNDFRMRLFKKGISHIKATVGPEVGFQIEKDWKPMLLQRQIKAIGSFGYLTIKKEKGNYLKYVKPALETLTDSNLYDDRWPFISKKIIEYIGNTL
ncbi:MAG: phosphotransferase [Oligoflexales bacterium]|nr:phosphotransferase [Oligoflexales bacterium]